GPGKVAERRPNRPPNPGPVECLGLGLADLEFPLNRRPGVQNMAAVSVVALRLDAGNPYLLPAFPALQGRAKRRLAALRLKGPFYKRAFEEIADYVHALLDKCRAEV